jgi:hypothetical protein
VNSGVYQIKCLPTGKFYIGSSINLRRRWATHRAHLKRQSHHSRHMQNAWNRHGPEAFEFTVLVYCGADMLLVYEQIMLDSLKPVFNTVPVAGSCLGRRNSEEYCKKMSALRRSRNKKYDYLGEQLCLTDIAERAGFPIKLLIARVLSLGMTIDTALSQPRRPHRQTYEHDGRALTIKQWAKELGMHPRRITYWLDSGMSIADCMARLTREAKSLSLPQFCHISGVNLQTMKSRMQIGIPVMQALTMPTVQRDQSWRTRAPA